MKIRPVGT